MNNLRKTYRDSIQTYCEEHEVEPPQEGSVAEQLVLIRINSTQLGLEKYKEQVGRQWENFAQQRAKLEGQIASSRQKEQMLPILIETKVLRARGMVGKAQKQRFSNINLHSLRSFPHTIFALIFRYYSYTIRAKIKRGYRTFTYVQVFVFPEVLTRFLALAPPQKLRLIESFLFPVSNLQSVE